MALYPCPECKRLLSRDAVSCPGCGHILQRRRRSKLKLAGQLLTFAGLLGVLFVGVVGGETDAITWTFIGSVAAILVGVLLFIVGKWLE